MDEKIMCQFINSKLILTTGSVIEKIKERKQKSSSELYLPDISVCNTNLQRGYKRKMNTDKRCHKAIRISLLF